MYNAAVDQAQQRILVVSGSLADSDFLQVPWAVETRGKNHVLVRICEKSSRCDLCNLDRPLFFAHFCCWKVICSHRTPPLSTVSLYALAQQTRPVVSPGRMVERRSHLSLNVSLSPFLQETGLGNTLHNIASRLPQEIEFEILSYLTNTMVFSLISSLQTSICFGLIRPDTSQKQTVLETPDGTTPSQISHLYAVPVRVFENMCISRLSASKIDHPTSLSIPIREGSVRGLRYVLGAYGICAVSILYNDGPPSPWLGDPGGGWQGKVYGHDLRKLHITHDVLSFPLLPSPSRGRLDANSFSV